MNLRNPKVIRLGGWGALTATVLAVAAGTFLGVTFFQSGDMLTGGIATGMTLATALLGGLLSYGAFLFASMQSLQARSSETETATLIATAETETAIAPAEPEEDEFESAILPSAEGSMPGPPELSDEAIPVFDADSVFGSDAPAADYFDEDLLVVPPPVNGWAGSDIPEDEPEPTDEASDDFDSRMDLPVTIDCDDTGAPESSDDIAIAEPARVVESPTAAIESRFAAPAKIDAIVDEPAPEFLHAAAESNLAERMPATVSPAVALAVQAFPEIFKSAPPIKAEAAPPAVAPAPIAAPVTPAPIAAPVVPAGKTKPNIEAVPDFEAKVVSKPEPQPLELLPTAAELPDMATTLTPTVPTAGALPSEIPDFFLRMPTGRPAPSARQAPPTAPVAPRQVAPPKPMPAAAPSAVRIIDSTSVNEQESDLVTMTAIPDDWPS